MSARDWKRLRQGTQALAFLLFVYLLMGTRQEGFTLLPHDLFFRLDPLGGLAATIAGRRWIAVLALGGVTLLAAAALGRAWCGWICPMGTVLDVAPNGRTRNDIKDLSLGWRQFKHLLLFAIFGAALFGNLTLLVLDPLTLLFRTLGVAVLPALDASITASETSLYNIEAFQWPLETFDQVLRGLGLPVDRRFFQQNTLLLAMFAGVLALNFVRPRFWCRYLCPLGSLLGVIAKVSWLRHRVDQSACNSCGRCARVCPTGTINPTQNFAADPAECTVCLNCVESCANGAIDFGGQVGLAEWQRYDPTRRQLLNSLGMGIVAVAVLRTAPSARREGSWLVRPPGARENDLLGKCIRCGECLKVCPTAGLQPSLFEAGWEGLWTPVLVSRLGYCDYSCNACGQVCPTGAIPPLPLEEKREAVIGLAYIDKNRCIPWADARDCIVCEEMCPVPEKAIILDEQTVANAEGEKVTVRLPSVVRKRCIGCGICETKCPVNGDAAIRVYVPGELPSNG